MCSSDVASALAAAGMLDYAPALAANLNVDDTGNYCLLVFLTDVQKCTSIHMQQ